MHHLHPIDYAIIIAYLVIITIIGLVLTRKASSSLEHYYLGGRAMPWWMLGIAGMSNWFDLTGTMIITSFLYLLGPRGLYIEFRGGAVLGLAFLLVYGGKWHRRSGCMTGAEWMVYRFGRDKSVQAVRVISSVTALVCTVALLAYLVRGTSLFLGQMVPYSPTHMTILLVGLTALYTMFAGFYGVVITDMIQGVIIMISCVVIALMAWHAIPDAGHLLTTAAGVTQNAHWTNSLPEWRTTMPKGYEAYQALILFASFYLIRSILGGLGGGAESRYFGARSDRECGLQSLLQGFTIMFRWPLMMGFAVLGIYLVSRLFPDQATVARVHDLIAAYSPTTSQGMWHELTAGIAAQPQDYPPALIQQLQHLMGPDWTRKIHLVGYLGTVNPEQILPAVLLNVVPAGLAGFIIVAMIAAMKGSLAGMVNGTSAYFVKDIYQNLIRPQAGNRELIAASWISTAVMMALGLYMGLCVKNINTIWSWIIMSLTAGGLAPALLRLYWWRCNAWGMFGGTLVGCVASILQYHFWPDMVEWQQFLLMTALSFAGTIGGSYLVAPAPLDTMRHFYRTTRPFGLWGPLWRELSPVERQTFAREHRADILAVPFALVWQVLLFLMPMQLLIKTYHTFFCTLPVFVVAAAGMYWFWWRNLPPPEAQTREEETMPGEHVAAALERQAQLSVTGRAGE